MLILIAMDGTDTGLAIAPICIVFLFAGWVIYASCKKKTTLEERINTENEII